VIKNCRLLILWFIKNVRNKNNGRLNYFFHG
jgi:hypothetical protein